MLVHTPGIVLSTVKYGEADLIARIYTKELGTQSFMIKGVRKSRKGAMRVSFFQPLTQLQIVTQFKGKNTLEYIKEASVSPAYDTMHVDIVKSSITLFFSELLTQLLTEQQPDDAFYDYLHVAFVILDQSDKVANFAIKFLLDITSFLGFQPDVTNDSGDYFSLETGSWDNHAMLPNHATLEESKYLKSFLGTHFDAIETIKMSRVERNAVLNVVIDYFQIHLHSFKRPTSLSILKQLFD